MELNLERCDIHRKGSKSHFEVFNLYVNVCNGWVILKSYSSLAAAKRYALKYVGRFDPSSRRIPDFKISKFNHPFGECLRDYYFSVK